jgi:transcriptional regulator with XRE-family HTH domain
MGIVSDKDFHSELGNCGSPNQNKSPVPTKAVVIDSPTKGRGENNVEVPNGLRKLIGVESVTNGRQSALELASNLGISPSSVSAYANGATSTASYDDRPNISQINLVKEKVSKRARGKLMLALHHITDEKLSEAKVRDLAAIAKDMSAVVRDMEPAKEANVNTQGGPTFIFYSPQFRKEEHFDVVQVKE